MVGNCIDWKVLRVEIIAKSLHLGEIVCGGLLK